MRTTLLIKAPLFLIIASASLFLSFSRPEKLPAISSRELTSKIFEAIDNVKTLRYSLQCNERIKGRMQHTESKVKLQTSPRKLYLSLKGPEVLWIAGQNGGNALVNPGSFPYINLNLDPYGSLMRKDQHHTIHEMGFHYLQAILKDGLRRSGDKVEKFFVVLPEEKHNGRDCYKLSISFPDFAWSSYTVKKGENLNTIARKLHVSEYMVLENNPKLTWYTDVKEGMVIQVPNAYAKVSLLLIDKELLLPVNNKVFDDKGLFETYEYFDLQVNTPIAPEEFSKDYKGYNF
jgi:outer membrane lipoprotein-sorting protein